MGVFLTKLSGLPHAGQINVIITSDHGMGSTTDEKMVVMETHLKTTWIDKIKGYNPNFVIKANSGCVDSIYSALSDIQGISVWRSENVPDQLHYGKHPRTLDLVVVADSSWSVVRTAGETVGKGAHGYLNSNTDMHAIFYAAGPAFRKNFAMKTFDNIDIYPLICEILNLYPAPTDGSLNDVRKMLKNTE